MNQDDFIFGTYYNYPQADQLKEISARPHIDAKQLSSSVGEILADVKEHGDEAIKNTNPSLIMLIWRILLLVKMNLMKQRE